MDKYVFISDEDYETAAKNGISKKNVQNRVRYYGWTVKDAITLPIISRHRRVWGLNKPEEYRDLILTDEQLKTMHENGLNRSMVFKRIFEYGWEIEIALTHPKIPRSERGKGLRK